MLFIKALDSVSNTSIQKHVTLEKIILAFIQDSSLRPGWQARCSHPERGEGSHTPNSGL